MENVNVQLFNSQGRLIYNKRTAIEQKNLEISFDTFPIGVYFLKIDGLNLQEEFKVIKE